MTYFKGQVTILGFPNNDVGKIAESCYCISSFPIVPETKITEFSNSIDLDEVAHNEPPHLDQHCLPSSL